MRRLGSASISRPRAAVGLLLLITQKQGAGPAGIYGTGEETASPPRTRFRPDASAASVPIRGAPAVDEVRA